MALYTTNVATDFSSDESIGSNAEVSYVGIAPGSTSVERLIFKDDSLYFDCYGSFFADVATQQAYGTITAFHVYDLNFSLQESISNIALSLEEIDVFTRLDGDINQLIFRDSDRIQGSAFNDVMLGYGGNDWINGGAGNDRLLGNEGTDEVFGGDGNDSIVGGASLHHSADLQDSLYGENGNDHIYGCGGDDYISGGVGNDLIAGGEGNDTIYGDESPDQQGRDIFVYFGNTGHDVINHFNRSDIISVQRTATLQSFSDIEMEFTNGDFIVSLGNGNTMEINSWDFNFNEESLQTSNFFFYG